MRRVDEGFAREYKKIHSLLLNKVRYALRYQHQQEGAKAKTKSGVSTK